jgi:hypothetical protein
MCSYFIPADQMSTYRIGTVWTIKEEEEEEEETYDGKSLGTPKATALSSCPIQ